MAPVQGPATASVASSVGRQPVKVGWGSVGVAAGAVPTTVEVVAPVVSRIP